MQEKFWDFERVSKLPVGRRESYVRNVVEDFISMEMAIAKIHGVKVSAVCPMRKYIALKGYPLSVYVRKKEVYLVKNGQ